jgi:hypothetical protein
VGKLNRAPHPDLMRRGRERTEVVQGKGPIMLWTLFVVLAVLWLLGFSLHVGGGLIHLLLVVALVVLIFNFLGGRRVTG